MKKLIRRGLVPFFFLLSACGQPGPLYLPTDKPPIYVPPEEKTQKESENRSEDAQKDQQKELNTPPSPENKETIGQ